jgi:tight adherence protein B
MTAATITLLTFVTVTLCVLGAAGVITDLFLKERARVNERFREALRDELRERAQSSPLFKDLRFLPSGDVLPNESLWRQLQTWIDQSGYGLQIYQVALLSVAAGLLVWVVIAVVIQSMLLATCMAIATAAAPWVFLHCARNRRRTILCQQLPEVFEVMSRAIRVGQTVQSAFQLVGNDFPPPVSQEFAYCYEQQHLGISQEAALRDLARRMPIMELRIFAVALIINSRTGGNLAELLLKLATLIRKRLTLAGRIKALTGEGRMQALVLALLPVILFFVMLAWNPEYIQELIDRPLILAGCVVSQAIGILWIRRVSTISY